LKGVYIFKRFPLAQWLFWLPYSAMAVLAFGQGIDTAADALVAYCFFLLPGIGITSLYRWYLQKRPTDFTAIRRILPVLLVALGIHGTCFLVFQLGYHWANGQEDVFQGAGWLGFTAIVFIIAAIVNLPWYFLYHSYRYVTALHQQQLQALQYREENARLQIESLTNKLNPHFLFNTLNTIRWLTGKNDEQARNAINDLSEILRYNLGNLDKKTIPLQEELHIVKKYLAFEKLRFEERLSFAIDCPETAFGFPVIPFSILTHVENSIKHGIGQLPEGGKIVIRVSEAADSLHIAISNTGRLIGQLGDGFGLDSLKKLYAQAYRNDFAIRMENNHDDEVLVTIKIPRP
jgi:two-component system, LytTR family, sensor kinase